MVHVDWCVVGRCCYKPLFADYDQPLVLESAGGKSTENDQFMPDSEAVEMIVGMGFSQHQATVALRATVSNHSVFQQHQHSIVLA